MAAKFLSPSGRPWLAIITVTGLRVTLVALFYLCSCGQHYSLFTGF